MNPTMKLLMLTREPEERFRDRRGREHYDNGRYAPVSELDAYHYPPPVYEERERGGMNQIGFALDNNREIGGDYRSDAAYSRTDELGHRSPRMARGKPAAAATDTLTRENGGGVDGRPPERGRHEGAALDARTGQAGDGPEGR